MLIASDVIRVFDPKSIENVSSNLATLAPLSRHYPRHQIMSFSDFDDKDTMNKLPFANFSAKKIKKMYFPLFCAKFPGHPLHKLQNCTTMLLDKILIIII